MHRLNGRLRPSKHPKKAEPDSYRILSLDGGGTTGGYIEICALIDIFGEETTGHEVLRRFDDVVMTSVGALIGAALGADYPLRDIRSMLECEAFLRGIYAAKDKATQQQSKGERPNYFGPDPYHKGLTSLAMAFVVASVEITTGGFFSTEKKTEYLRKVLGHEVEPEHPAAKAIPAIANNKMEGLGSETFDKLPGMIGLNYQGKPVHMTCVCQDEVDRRINLVTTRDNMPSEGKILGNIVRRISGDKVPFAEAASASPNPKPFFDKAVCVGDRKCNDGGMTGHNAPLALAVASAIQRGIPAKSISLLSLGVGDQDKSYVSPQALRHPMIFGALPFDLFFPRCQAERLKEVNSMLSPDQVVRIAPTSKNPKEPSNYISSTFYKEEDIKAMMKMQDDYTIGNIENQLVQGNGYSNRLSAIDAAKARFDNKASRSELSRKRRAHHRPDKLAIA